MEQYGVAPNKLAGVVAPPEFGLAPSSISPEERVANLGRNLTEAGMLLADARRQYSAASAQLEQATANYDRAAVELTKAMDSLRSPTPALR